MSKIDLLKLKKRIDSHQPFYFVTQPAYIPQTASILIALSLIPIANNPFQYVISFLYSLRQLCILKQRYKLYKQSGNSITYQIISDKITNTTEYQECSKLYDTYIKKVAEYLHIYNFSSSKELLIFMEHFLIMGAFSKNFNHQYRQYKNNYEYANDLLGATALTGTCVCRHMASLFNDIVNAYGETSSFLVVRTETSEDINTVIKNTDAKFEHAVIGVKSDNQKYIFDPTSGTFASCITEISDPHLNATVAKTISSIPINKYYVQAPAQLVLKDCYRESTIEVSHLPFAKISPEEINYYYNQATTKYLNNTSATNDFFIENQSQVRRISELIGKISPSTDEEITEWQLTKLPKQTKKH